MDKQIDDPQVMPAFSRRQWLLGSTVTASFFALGSSAAFAAPDAASDNGISRTAEAIHQEVLFKAAPERVYKALTDASQFQKVELLSGVMKSLDLNAHPSTISSEAGGAFALFGGYIVGRQIELVANQRIVQAWRVQNWTAGVYSIARFELAAEGTSTKLIFDHTGFPAGAAEHLAAGWHANYWELLQKFLA